MKKTEDTSKTLSAIFPCPFTVSDAMEWADSIGARYDDVTISLAFEGRFTVSQVFRLEAKFPRKGAIDATTNQ